METKRGRAEWSLVQDDVMESASLVGIIDSFRALASPACSESPKAVAAQATATGGRTAADLTVLLSRGGGCICPRAAGKAAVRQ